MKKACHDHLTPQEYEQLDNATKYEAEQISRRTAWNISATLREFPSFPDFTIWFDYPVHTVDVDGLTEKALSDGKRKKKEKPSESKGPAWGSEEARNNGREKMLQRKDEEKERNKAEFEQALDAVGTKVDDVIAYYDGSLKPRAIKSRAQRYGYSIVNGHFVDTHTLENLIPS
jgi:hypothetical protein